MKNSSTHSNRSLVNDYAEFVDFYLVPKFLPGTKPSHVPLIDKHSTPCSTTHPEKPVKSQDVI